MCKYIYVSKKIKSHEEMMISMYDDEGLFSKVAI